MSFASIHTTTITGMMVLLDLATWPEYIRELRAELVEVLREEGEAIVESRRRCVSKASFARMCKLDNFVKES